MQLGLICDIHEHVEHLQQALDHFSVCSVDRIVVIGDLFETGERIEELCRLLAAAGVVGVWGNHDYGLCVDPEFATFDTQTLELVPFNLQVTPGGIGTP